MNADNIPQICVRCKKTTEMDEFLYSRSRRKGLFRKKKSTISSQISFPVCRPVKKEFKKYKKYETIYDAIARYLLIVFVFSTSLYVYQTIFNLYISPSGLPSPYTQPEDILMLVLFYVSISSLIFFISLFIIVNKHPKRIKQYIKMTPSGKVTITDERIIDEIDNKLSQEIEAFEQNIDVIFCPKCGAKYSKKNVDFCNVCGKNLKGLK